MPGDPRLDDSADARADDRARKEGRRNAHGLVLVVAVLFIASSTVQIVRGVFGLGEASRPGDACAEGVARLSAQIDARAACSGCNEAPAARRSREASEAATVARACAASSDGLDTWAAFERARMAREQLARGEGDPGAPRGLMHAPPLGDEAAPLPVDLR
jgi:hypothetical protein